MTCSAMHLCVFVQWFLLTEVVYFESYWLCQSHSPAFSKKNSIGLAFYVNLNAFRYLSFDVLFRKWTKLSTPRLWHESCHNGWFNPIFHECDFRFGSSTLRFVQKSLTLHRRIASILTIGSYQFRLFDSLTSCRKLLARLSPILVNKTNVLIQHSLLNW